MASNSFVFFSIDGPTLLQTTFSVLKKTFELTEVFVKCWVIFLRLSIAMLKKWTSSRVSWRLITEVLERNGVGLVISMTRRSWVYIQLPLRRFWKYIILKFVQRNCIRKKNWSWFKDIKTFWSHLSLVAQDCIERSLGNSGFEPEPLVPHDLRTRLDIKTWLSDWRRWLLLC